MEETMMFYCGQILFYIFFIFAPDLDPLCLLIAWIEIFQLLLYDSIQPVGVRISPLQDKGVS